MLTSERRKEIRERRDQAVPDAGRVQYPMAFTMLVDFDIPALLDHADDADAEIARLRAALEWYADPETWRRGKDTKMMYSGDDFRPVEVRSLGHDADKDAGARARAALGGNVA